MITRANKMNVEFLKLTLISVSHKCDHTTLIKRKDFESSVQLLWDSMNITKNSCYQL